MYSKRKQVALRALKGKRLLLKGKRLLLMLSSWEQNCFLLDKTQFELGDSNKFGRVLSTESASVYIFVFICIHSLYVYVVESDYCPIPVSPNIYVRTNTLEVVHTFSFL